MPLKSHRSEYTILAVLGLITGLVLVAMAWRGWLREEPSGSANVRTTRSTNVDAALICYTLLERLELNVGRFDAIFTAERHEDTGVVFLIDPIVPVGAGEVGEWSDWIFRGGVLVTTTVPPGLDRALDHLPDRWRLPSRYPVSVTGRRPQGQQNVTNIPSEVQTLPLARNVSEVAFAAGRVFDDDLLEADSPVVLEPLLADRRGARIVERKVGHGRVIILADSSFLANGLITKADNALLAVNLAAYALAHAKTDRLLFEEYHLGYGHRHGGFSVLARMLVTNSAGWAVLSLTAAGLLLLWHKGRQFGPRRGLPGQRRRSKLEYVVAVGATFRAAGAHRMTLELLSTWFRQRITNSIGLLPSASNDMIASELAQRSRLDLTDCRRVLDECDRLVARSAISERQLRTAAEGLARIEKEAMHGSIGGK